MKLYMKVVAVGLLALLLVSCSSLKGFKNPVGEGNLYGLIIDEKNQPVKDFKIVCSDERESVKSAVTNDSGIFVIENMLTGNLTISGVGDGYVKIKNEKIEFLGNEKIFCWQISSLEGVLLEVERQIKEKNYLLQDNFHHYFHQKLLL